MTPARNNVRATRHFGIPTRKSSPSAPLQPFPREKTRPARPSNRSRAKKFAQQQPNPGQTAKKLAQHAQKHQNLAIFPEQGELFRVSNAAPPSREIFLPQLHHSIPITGTPPPIHHPNRYKTLPTTPTINENWPFLASRENSFPFPTPHHRAGRIFSRNNTTQYPSQGHHHPNRHKTHPATPPTTRSAGGTSQHAVQNSPSTPTSKPNRYKTLPTTPATRLDRYKTLPARPKTTKTGHFSPAGRIISRSQHRTTEQGEFSPATTPSWCLFQRS